MQKLLVEKKNIQNNTIFQHISVVRVSDQIWG